MFYFRERERERRSFAFLRWGFPNKTDALVGSISKVGGDADRVEESKNK